MLTNISENITPYIKLIAHVIFSLSEYSCSSFDQKKTILHEFSAYGHFSLTSIWLNHCPISQYLANHLKTDKSDCGENLENFSQLKTA